MLKLAVTDAFAVIVTVQAAVPLQAPPHPLKTAFAPGVAVSVTCVLGVKLVLHELPQLIPAGVLVILPLPVPET
ncbi:MAG TPA: hypothetical protein VFB28_01895 [Terriglobales bacterium]|nr:hypothetical protein [Terriglobales bacterium]